MVSVKSSNSGHSFVIYLRVSTSNQGENGNGINAQERDIDIFLSHQNEPLIIKKFVEVESGGIMRDHNFKRQLLYVRKDQPNT